MNSSINNYDALEKLIFDEGLRIEALDFHIDLDLMLVILNSKAVLHQKISSHKHFANASIEQLNNFRIIANGTGIHWAELDEDLSLKGFLQDELRIIIHRGNVSNGYAA
jgi:hypothetical protein